MTQFAADVSRIAKKMNQTAENVARAVIIEVMASTIEDTPVGNPDLWKNPAPKGYVGGRLKGNWQTTVGAPAVGEVSEPDKSGGRTIAKVHAKVRNPNLYFLTNNLPYAERVEFYGWSKRAKAGMLRKNVRRVHEILRRKIK